MEIDEAWIPIISQSLEWIRGKMGPSKKDLKIRIDELEERVNLLSYGNEILMQNTIQIMEVIIYQLKGSGDYVINADTIIQINQDNNSILNINMGKTTENVKQTKLDTEFNCSLFDKVDEEVLQYRLNGFVERNENL